MYLLSQYNFVECKNDVLNGNRLLKPGGGLSLCKNAFLFKINSFSTNPLNNSFSFVFSIEKMFTIENQVFTRQTVKLFLTLKYFLLI